MCVDSVVDWLGGMEKMIDELLCERRMNYEPHMLAMQPTQSNLPVTRATPKKQLHNIAQLQNRDIAQIQKQK